LACHLVTVDHHGGRLLRFPLDFRDAAIGTPAAHVSPQAGGVL
jgi:hypothetical protein